MRFAKVFARRPAFASCSSSPWVKRLFLLALGAGSFLLSDMIFEKLPPLNL
jgi:hypothetical protein